MKVRINADHIKTAENVLASLGAIDNRISFLETQLDKASLDGAPSDIRGIDYSTPGGGSYHNDAMLSLTKVQAIKARIKREHDRRQDILACIERLSPEDAELLTNYYVQDCTMEQVADLLTDGDVRKLYRLKKKAVCSFALYYYGSEAVEGIRP